MSEQERQMIASGDLMPLSKVARLTPYSAEYLSLLARKGKFPALKLNRDWMTTSEAVLSYVHKQHIKHMEELMRFNNTYRTFNEKSNFDVDDGRN